VKRQGPSVTTLREESTVGSLQCTAGPAALEAISCQLSALSQATISTFNTSHSTLRLPALRPVSLLISPISSLDMVDSTLRLCRLPPRRLLWSRGQDNTFPLLQCR
jgi:hypothetical protein